MNSKREQIWVGLFVLIASGSADRNGLSRIRHI